MCNLEVETAKQILTLNTSKLYKHTRKLHKPNSMYNNITWYRFEQFCKPFQHIIKTFSWLLFDSPLWALVSSRMRSHGYSNCINQEPLIQHQDSRQARTSLINGYWLKWHTFPMSNNSHLVTNLTLHYANLQKDKTIRAEQEVAVNDPASQWHYNQNNNEITSSVSNHPFEVFIPILYVPG